MVLATKKNCQRVLAASLRVVSAMTGNPPLELIDLRYHLVVAFCIIMPYILQGVMISVSKTGNTKSFSKTQFMVHRTE